VSIIDGGEGPKFNQFEKYKKQRVKPAELLFSAQSKRPSGSQTQGEKKRIKIDTFNLSM